MPGDPAQCRIYAARYLKLSERAKDRARRQQLASLAQTWTKLAAELESDQALLNALSEINVDEPFYAVPEALNLRAAYGTAEIAAANLPPSFRKLFARGG